MSKELDPAAKREGYVEAPRVASEKAAAKTTYFKPAPDPKALRDVSSDPRAKMAGVVISADGHIDPIGVKVSVGDPKLDPAYEVVRDATIANSVLPDEEGLAFDTSDAELQSVIGRAEARANTRCFDSSDPDSPAHNVHNDEVFVNNALYSTGQNTDRLQRMPKKPTGYTGAVSDATAGYPAFSNNGKEEGSLSSYQNYDATGLRRSNFRHHSLTIKVVGGNLESLAFDASEYPVTTAPGYVDKTSLASVAGDEHVEAAWDKLERATNAGHARTPFVRQMLDPLAVMRLLRDVVLDTGAHMCLATRTLNQAISYQIFNQKAKTGGNAIANLQRMIRDGLFGVAGDFTDIPTSDPDVDVCSKKACEAGSVAAFVRPNLSRTRYSDHHTFLTYDGGVAGYAKKLNANVHNFFAHKGFLAAMRQTELYSTVEGAVGPANPIWITELHDVFSPMDWNLFCTYGSTLEVSQINPSVISDHGLISKVLARYTLDDNIQEYLGVGHPLITGIHEALTSPVEKFRSGAAMLAYAIGKQDFTITVPVEYSTTAPTFWQMLLGLAADHVAQAQRHYLSALTENTTVPMEMTEFEPDAVKLSTTACFASDSYVLSGWNKPIQPKVMSDVQRLRYCVPEDFSFKGQLEFTGDDLDNTNNVSFAPWYLSAADFRMGVDIAEENSCRQADVAEPDVMHTPKYGIVGLKTDVVARAIANADDMTFNEAYGVIADLRSENAGVLIPYARTEYQTVRIAIKHPVASEGVTFRDVWCMPRFGNGFLQMPGGRKGYATWTSGEFSISLTDSEEYESALAVADTLLSNYENEAAQALYGSTKPAGTLRSRIRKLVSAAQSPLVRKPANSDAIREVHGVDKVFWPKNRSIVGAKPYTSIQDDSKLYSVVGMLVEHPTYTYLGARGTMNGGVEGNGVVVDPLCEFYASGLLVSRAVKSLIPTAYQYETVPS